MIFSVLKRSRRALRGGIRHVVVASKPFERQRHSYPIDYESAPFTQKRANGALFGHKRCSFEEKGAFLELSWKFVFAPIYLFTNISAPNFQNIFYTQADINGTFSSC